MPPPLYLISVFAAATGCDPVVMQLEAAHAHLLLVNDHGLSHRTPLSWPRGWHHHTKCIDLPQIGYITCFQQSIKFEELLSPLQVLWKHYDLIASMSKVLALTIWARPQLLSFRCNSITQYISKQNCACYCFCYFTRFWL